MAKNGYTANIQSRSIGRIFLGSLHYTRKMMPNSWKPTQIVAKNVILLNIFFGIFLGGATIETRLKQWNPTFY